MNDEYQKKYLFTKAFALVSNPDTWCQDYYAKDCNGNQVCYTDLKAVCWCSTGAMSLMGVKYPSYFITNNILQNDFNHFCMQNWDRSLASLNDKWIHVEVVQLWKQFGISKGYI